MASAAVVEKSYGSGGAGSNKAVLCKYYINGVCREGKTCRYSHDQETSSPDMVCRYYLYGCCSYGSMCRYDHVKPKGENLAGPQPKSTLPHFSLPKQTTTTTSKQCGGRGGITAPPPPPPLLPASAPTPPPLPPPLPPVPHRDPQNGFCSSTVGGGGGGGMIDWQQHGLLLDSHHHHHHHQLSSTGGGVGVGTPTTTTTDDTSCSFYPSSIPWSTAPSASDKVILRGGRIKTKADWAKDSQEFVPRKPINVPGLTYAQALSVEGMGGGGVGGGGGGGCLATSPPPPQQPLPQPQFEPGSLEPATADPTTTTTATATADPDDDCSALEYTPKFDYPDPVFQEKVLCPYLEHGACPDMDSCCYLHGDLCEMCGANVLHPTNLDQRKEHEAECVRRLEENMEYSFLIAGSKNKECTICMEIVLDKKPPDNRFGLLANCNHTFCLSCIRKWRSSSLDKNVIRSCPQCRTSSNFVTPSNVWVEDKEQKEKIINDYKEKMRKKPCKYFDMGRSKCPFGDSCFYKHSYPDGRLASPEKPGSRRHRAAADGTVSCVPDQSLWDFIFEREQAAAVAMEAFDDDDFYNLMWTSSDDSDGLDDSDGDEFGIFGNYDDHMGYIYGEVGEAAVVVEVDDEDDDDESIVDVDVDEFGDVDDSNGDDDDDDDDDDVNDADDDADDDDDDDDSSSSSSNSSSSSSGGGAGSHSKDDDDVNDNDDDDVDGREVTQAGPAVAAGGGGSRERRRSGTGSNCDVTRSNNSKDKMKGSPQGS